MSQHELAKEKEPTGAESQTKATGNTSAAQPMGTDESSTPGVDEAEHTQTTSVSGGEGGPAPATTSKGDAPAPATTSANEDLTSDAKKQSRGPSGHAQADVDKQPKEQQLRVLCCQAMPLSQYGEIFGLDGVDNKDKGECHRCYLKDARYDWILKSSDFKGTHKLAWPGPQDHLAPFLVTGNK